MSKPKATYPPHLDIKDLSSFSQRRLVYTTIGVGFALLVLVICFFALNSGAARLLPSNLANEDMQYLLSGMIVCLCILMLAVQMLFIIKPMINEIQAQKLALQDAEEKRLSFSEQLEDVLSISDEWLWRTNERFIIIDVSKNFSRATGLEYSEILGRSYREFQKDLEFHQEKWNRLLEYVRSKQPFQDLEFIFSYPDRADQIFNLHGKPVFDIGGNFRGYQGIGRDITEDYKQREKLAKAMVEAEAGNKTKADFLATMSHEIRTPLNGVLGMNALLLGTSLTPEQKHYAVSTQESGERLLNLLNDILDLSKLETVGLNFEAIDFDLEVLMLDTLLLFAPKAHEKGLSLSYTLPDALRQGVRSDPNRLRQVLTNLVSNAVKFTERGVISLHVSIKKETLHGYSLRFEVIDSGIGISHENQKDLFQKFTQADMSTARKYGGTGLGLAICKQIVERMEGDVGFESTVGFGSTFWFTAKMQKPEVLLINNARALENLSIGVVYHSMSARQALTNLLQDFGAKVPVTTESMLDMRPLLQNRQLARLDVLFIEQDTLLYNWMDFMGWDAAFGGTKTSINPAAVSCAISQKLGVPVVILHRLGTALSANLEGSIFVSLPQKPSDIIEAVRQSARCLLMEPEMPALVEVEPVQQETEGDTSSVPIQKPDKKLKKAKAPKLQQSPVVEDVPKGVIESPDVVPEKPKKRAKGSDLPASLISTTETDTATIKAAEVYPGGLQHTRRNILVAEDQAINQMLIRALLEKQGYQVTIVEDGEQAVDAVDKGNFDLVLMDIQMPKVSGLQAAEWIRQLEGVNAKVPIIALTAHAMIGDRDTILASGINDYLTKPIDAEKLFALMDQYLRDTP